MTTSSHAESPPTQAPAKYKRRAKNYLIDSRFQLKYTGLILLVALVISSVLGAVLWRTSQEVIAESDKLVEESKKVVAESQKVSDIVSMSIKDDPVYSQQPELQAAFKAESNKNDEVLAKRQAALGAQQAATQAQQRSMIATLVGGLSLMVLLIGILGIYFTHKVAGPIYKMKMLLTQVGEGKLPQSRLRKGDELQDFFAAFATMVDRSARAAAQSRGRSRQGHRRGEERRPERRRSHRPGGPAREDEHPRRREDHRAPRRLSRRTEPPRALTVAAARQSQRAISSRSR